MKRKKLIKISNHTNEFNTGLEIGGALAPLLKPLNISEPRNLSSKLLLSFIGI